jgi:phytoene dehydrogenase-like protein
VNAPRHAPGDRAKGIDWLAPELADRYADQVLDLMAARGVDIRERVLWRELRTPADLERHTRAVGGSIYGTSSNGTKAAFLRPANRSPFEGLYLVGGSSHPGGGLPLVTLSAQIVAEMVGVAGSPVRVSTR